MAETPPPDRWECIWEAFWRLDTDRPHRTQGMAAPMGGSLIMSVPGPIPWTVLQDYCDRTGQSPEDRDLMEVCIRKMEDIYLPWWLEKNRPRQ